MNILLKFIITSIMFFCVINCTQADIAGTNRLNKKIVGGGNIDKYSFNIQNNNEGEIYLIRIEIPENSNYEITELINCPIDLKSDDRFTWSMDYSSDYITCQTSPNPNNPNLIFSEDIASINFTAKAPMPDNDTLFLWKIITEHKPNFEQILDLNMETLVDVNPPKIINATLKDTNNNYLIDTATIEFDEEINFESFQANDFTLDGIKIDEITKTEDEKKINLKLINNEINKTNFSDLLYNFNDGFGLDLFNHSMLDVNENDILEIDSVKPKIIDHYLSEKTKIITTEEKILNIVFSEEMDINFNPTVYFSGVGFDSYVIEKINFENNIWQGKIQLPDKDEEIEVDLKIFNYSDISKNINQEEKILDKFKVDTKGPIAILNNLPLDFTSTKNFSIDVKGEDLDYYRYKINNNEFSDKISSSTLIILENLDDGDYNLYVEGRDEYGNWQNEPTKHEWIIKTLAPTITQNKISAPNISSGGGGGGGQSSSITLKQKTISEVQPENKTTKKDEQITKNEIIKNEKVENNIKDIKKNTQDKNLEQILADAWGIYNKNISLWRDNDKKIDINNIYDKYTKNLIKDINDIDSNNIDRLNYFIAYGTPSTKILGAGERAGVINSFKSAFEKIPSTENDWVDIVKISNGRWTEQRSEKKEKDSINIFKKIYLRLPDEKISFDNNAIAIISYGLRPTKRNLESEKKAIIIFSNIFKKNPSLAVDWDIVRAIAYSGAKR